MAQNSQHRISFGGMAGCLLLIVAMVVVIGFMTWSRRNKLEPKLLFFIENGSEISPEIRVTIDEAVIFDGEARPTDRMPAIIFSQRLDPPSGRHNIRFEDRTRGITEVKTFDTSGTRTIFVHMEKSVLTNEHVVFYRELIYPK
jgi:hypothetical protein